MPIYTYRARSHQGKPLKGKIEALNPIVAVEKISSQGLVPTAVSEEKESFAFSRISFSLRTVKKVDLIIFTRQLATLLGAGLPLLESLNICFEQTANEKLKEVIGEVKVGIELGNSFSLALKKQPTIFPEFYFNMIKAGEASGELIEILRRLAGLLEYEVTTQAKFIAATRYPMMIILAIVLAFIGLVSFVIPKFAALFSRFQTTLPLPTRIMMTISIFFSKFFLWIFIFSVISIYFFRKYIQTEEGRFFWDSFKLKMIIVGALLKKIILSRFSRIMATLVQSGLPILTVLDVVARTLDNSVFAKEIEKIKKNVTMGIGLGNSFKKSFLFPPLLVQMVGVGEKTGTLEEMLFKVADYYDMEVDYTLKNLTTLIEPILVLVLGAMVLLMALAIFLPMWNLMSLFQQ